MKKPPFLPREVQPALGSLQGRGVDRLMWYQVPLKQACATSLLFRFVSVHSCCRLNIFFQGNVDDAVDAVCILVGLSHLTSLPGTIHKRLLTNPCSYQTHTHSMDLYIRRYRSMHTAFVHI